MILEQSFNRISMQKVRVDNFSISIDGFGAGPDQTLNDPLGKNGMNLHQWFFPTDTFQQMVSGKPGEKGWITTLHQKV